MVNQISQHIQVNIPFHMLFNDYISRFIESGINPEVGFDAFSLDNYSLSEFRQIAESLNRNHLMITFHAPFMDLSPGSPDPKIQEITKMRFEQILKLIPVFQPKSVVCHAGYDEKRYGYERNLWIEKSMETWLWLAERLRNHGSALMLENVYEHGPNELKILFQNLENQGVGFCLDTGHQAVFSRTSLDMWVEELGAYIGQLHLHDNNGTMDEHLALGSGKIDFRHFMKKLKMIKSRPPLVTLEPHREDDLWPSLDYLAELWPW